jgi:hypothetical protein
VEGDGERDFQEEEDCEQALQWVPEPPEYVNIWMQHIWASIIRQRSIDFKDANGRHQEKDVGLLQLHAFCLPFQLYLLQRGSAELVNTHTQQCTLILFSLAGIMLTNSLMLRLK